MFGGSSHAASDYCRTMFRCMNCTQQFDYHALDSSRILGGVAVHLIDGDEKHFVGWSLNFRLRSFGVIRIRISDPRSVWIKVHERNRWIHDQSGFTSFFDVHDPDRSWITDPDPEERTLRVRMLLIGAVRNCFFHAKTKNRYFQILPV